MINRSLRAAARFVGLVAIAATVGALVVSTAFSEPAARESSSLTALCDALSPPRVALPRALRTIGMDNYAVPLTPDAQAHRALCSVGLSSPSDGYRYNVGWDVFPTHALAAADFTSYPVNVLYSAVVVDRRAAGFPSPNFAVVGAGRLTGKGISVIAFVDGPLIVTAYIYGDGDALGAVNLIAHWALEDIKALERRGSTARRSAK